MIGDSRLEAVAVCGSVLPPVTGRESRSPGLEPRSGSFGSGPGRDFIRTDLVFPRRTPAEGQTGHRLSGPD